MEVLAQRTFDIFRYILPGMFVTCIILIIKSSEISAPDDIINFIDKIKDNRIVFFVLISYIIGIAHEQICISLIKVLNLNKPLIPEYVTKTHLSSSEKFALLRHYSPSNLSEIERWNMLKGMCINISGSLIYFVICCIIKSIFGSSVWQWLTITIISLICSYFIFNKSKVYQNWAIQDLDSTIDRLKLSEK